MPKRKHPTSAQTLDALSILGAQIAAGRRERRWTAEELADRAGISPRTLRSAERGLPTVSIGVAFELAVLVGVPLYGTDARGLADVRLRSIDRLSLLPLRVRERATDAPDDDF